MEEVKLRLKGRIGLIQENFPMNFMSILNNEQPAYCVIKFYENNNKTNTLPIFLKDIYTYSVVTLTNDVEIQ